VSHSVRVSAEGRRPGGLGATRYAAHLASIPPICPSEPTFSGTKYHGTNFRRALLDTIPDLGPSASFFALSRNTYSVR